MRAQLLEASRLAEQYEVQTAETHTTGELDSAGSQLMAPIPIVEACLGVISLEIERLRSALNAGESLSATDAVDRLARTLQQADRMMTSLYSDIK